MRQTVDAADALRLAGARLSEEQWQAHVMNAARDLGWTLRYHTRDSRGSAPGFPDLVICRPPRLIYAELKIEDPKRGTVTLEQRAWLNGLEACGQIVYVWRPSDWASVVEVLR